MSEELKKEDYAEPRCLLCNADGNPEPTIHLDVLRVLEKLDSYLDRDDYAGGERHLKYWLEETKNTGDGRGELLIHSELMGLYRKTGRKDEALSEAERGLSLLKELDMEDTVTAATVSVNAATVMKAFGRAAEALPLFERAQMLYEKFLKPGDSRLGGLYNNYALALTDEGQYGKARELYGKALAVAEAGENRQTEAAVTWLNLADTAEKELGAEAAEEEISRCLDMAEKLLDTPALPRNGYYAFVCDKCAGVFGYYGRFVYERELRERSEKIHAGT